MECWSIGTQIKKSGIIPALQYSITPNKAHKYYELNFNDTASRALNKNRSFYRDFFSNQ